MRLHKAYPVFRKAIMLYFIAPTLRLEVARVLHQSMDIEHQFDRS